MGLSKWHSGKEYACPGKGQRFDLWVGKIPWRRKWQPFPVFLPKKSHGQRILAGYSPWGHKQVRHDLVTKHTREQPRSRTLTPPNALKMQSKRIFIHCSQEWQNCAATLEDSLTASYRTKQFDSFLQNSYYMIQQLHSLVFTQMN